MAVSPKKTTKSRKGMRRSHHALKNVHLSYCNHCGEAKHSHCACSKCGHYKGRKVLNTAQNEA